MRPALIVAIVIFSIPSYSQPVLPGQLIIQKKCGTQHAHLLLDKSERHYPELFREIQVLDARPDTSRIGIVRRGTTRQDEILFEAPAASQLTGYLNAMYGRAKGDRSLLVVLKQLWIACPDNYVAHWDYPYNFYFHIESYLRTSNGFVPLTAMDTTLSDLKGETAGIVAGKQTRELFADFMSRLAMMNLDVERRTVSGGEIDSFNRTRFTYPMDTAVHLVKGAYNSADEFLRNDPSIPKAELQTGDGGNFELRIPDENGQLFYTHTVWGYCDGSHSYIMMDGNLFPIFQVQHQFYALGSKEYQLKGGIFIPFFIPLGPAAAIMGVTKINQSMARTLRIFRIDPVSGNVTE